MNEKCNVCGRFMNDNKSYNCENCNYGHCPKCSAESSEGSGEYPDEDAYSICRKCADEFEKADDSANDK